MTALWKDWEGRVVEGGYPLKQYLGGGRNSAVFATDFGGGKAAIKLVRVNPEDAAAELARWRRAARLAHPHLMKLLEFGTTEPGVVHVVMEYADESLSEVLPQRPLTPGEAQDLLEPTLEALAYVHGSGFVHGRLKPSNIQVADGRLKLASDVLCPVGVSRRDSEEPTGYDAPEVAAGRMSAASDIWSLGATLVESLSQRPLERARTNGDDAIVMPATLPAEMSAVALRCLEKNPQQRPSATQLLANLHPEPGNPDVVQKRAGAPGRRSTLVAAVLGLAIAILVGGAVLVGHQSSPGRPPEAPPDPAPISSSKTAPVPQNSAPAADEAAAQPSPGANSAVPQNAPTPVQAQDTPAPPAPPVETVPAPAPEPIVQRVLPDVPRKAQNTIQGKVRVAVRVQVDPSGTVSDARLESPGPSRYFAKLALEAAQQWKFAPSAVPSSWIVQFEFRRNGTQAIPVPAER